MDDLKDGGTTAERARYRNLKARFQHLAKLASRDRAAEIAKLAADDPAMAEELSALFRADARPVLDLSEGVTEPAPRRGPSSGPTSPSGSGDVGRFAAGTVLGARYRVVGLLGRGGMGEVYRADDLKLGEPVALKFLPRRFADDASVLERFHSEVRTARQISHRNVVRVHDLGEINGESFLAMEYVDGEDLASLLRRIGRLPQAKALELSRQLCAGLAAAHERGIVHRDLKPANVMIDGQGRARITDFGLAALAEEIEVGSPAGTPAYMAPEQLAEGRVSFASDVYSLGLVLYEMFTGETPFSANSRAELEALHRETDPSSLSSHVGSIDPLVERVILACLARDPEDRPGSPLTVLARLPGGDPLAEALAAGETPSPEMVARADVQGSLRPAVAAVCLAALLAALVASGFLHDRVDSAGLLRLPKAPLLLEEKAKRLIGGFGFETEGLGSRWGFKTDTGLFAHLRTQVEPVEAGARLASNRPPALLYWYHAGPLPLKLRGTAPAWPDVEFLRPGDVRIVLGPDGSLTQFAARPLDTSGTAEEVDWASVFADAGFELGRFRETPPRSVPEGPADHRRAWHGAYPEQPELEVRVEAATHSGRLVWFAVLLPWDATEDEALLGLRSAAAVTSIVAPVVLGLALVLAYRNHRNGRGDRRGAARLAGIVLAVLCFGWLFGAPHVEAGASFAAHLQTGIGACLFSAGFYWLIYIALEPALRRRSPASLVSWTRLLSGRVRDPLLGRDLLLGGLLGAVQALVWKLVGWIEGPVVADTFWPGALEGPAGMARVLLQALPRAVLFGAFTGIFIFTLLLMLVRQRDVAAILLAAVMSFQYAVVLASNSPGQWLAVSLMGLLFAGCVRYLGLLAALASCLFFLMLTVYPALTLNLSTWYRPATIAGWALLLALATYAYRTATAGRRRPRGPS